MRCSVKATLQPGGGTTGSHKVFATTSHYINPLTRDKGQLVVVANATVLNVVAGFQPAFEGLRINRN